MTEKNITAAEKQAALYSHIVVRKDMPLSAQMAQCAHAAQEAMRLNPSAELPIHVVILQCDNEAQLIKAAERLEQAGVSFHLFHEPHWPRGHSALGCAPQRKNKALIKALNGLKLWEPSDGAGRLGAVVEPSEDPLDPKTWLSESRIQQALLQFCLYHSHEAIFEAIYQLEDKKDAPAALAALWALARKVNDSQACDKSFGYAQAFAERLGWAQWLSEMEGSHMGSCCAISCSCSRCDVEDFFGLSTAPSSKAIGARLWRDIMEPCEPSDKLG